MRFEQNATTTIFNPCDLQGCHLALDRIGDVAVGIALVCPRSLTQIGELKRQGRRHAASRDFGISENVL